MTRLPTPTIQPRDLLVSISRHDRGRARFDRSPCLSLCAGPVAYGDLSGAHVSSAGGIWQAIDRGEEMGCDAVQVFTQSPRMWRPTNHTPEAVARFRERREEAGIGSVVCHALYLVNLASPDPVIHEKSVAAMRATLETADGSGPRASSSTSARISAQASRPASSTIVRRSASCSS